MSTRRKPGEIVRIGPNITYSGKDNFHNCPWPDREYVQIPSGRTYMSSSKCGWCEDDRCKVFYNIKIRGGEYHEGRLEFISECEMEDAP